MKALRSLAALSLSLFLSSCSLTQQAAPAPADEPAAAPKDSDKPSSTAKAGETAPAPTEEQQQAAAQLIEGVSDIDYTPEHTTKLLNEATEAPAPATSANGVPLPSGGLRMGSIIPKEDPASVGDAPAPTANSVELRGLRSPKMPSKLPMGIDGKLKSN